MRAKGPWSNAEVEAFLEDVRVPIRLACTAWRVTVLLLLLSVAGCTAARRPLEVADDVDLERYAGRWYEIASFPQRFQEGCVATTAEYALRDDGRIRVENRCRDRSFDGPVRSVEGVAWRTDPERTNAKLAVQFFWPFRGAYWIVAIDPDYRWAVVGHPSRDFLWILSREPALDPVLYDRLLEGIEAQGFDPARLRRTPQPLP